MRTLVTTPVLGALAALALAAPAPAAVTPSRDANAVAGAIAEQLPLGSFAGAGFVTIPPGQQANPAAIADSALTGFPTSGATYAILTSGDATAADDANDSAETSTDNAGGSGDPSHGEGVHDLVTLRINFSVPVGSSCLRLDARFLSEEFPEYVGGTVNDAFVAELDRSTFSAPGDGSVAAPDNFAFDQAGNLLSVNTAQFASEEAAGTTYDGATPRLRVSTPITPGRHSLFLSVFDQADAILDSAVFLDALRLEAAPNCERGATAVDTAAPEVTLISPARGASVGANPALAGAAGDAPGDSGTVDVRILGGAGQVVQALTATRSGTGWSAQGGPLAPGTYTAQVSQADAAGNVGSDAGTFTVVAPPPPGPPPPGPPPPPDPPVTGKAVNVEPVEGVVTVKTPKGRTVRLEDAEQIPTGSVVDTRKGTVRLFSTGKNGTIRNARFFDGLFRVTQTRGSKPVTDLKLVEPLARCKPAKRGRATAAAKRKKRRLWGDGKGTFRTSGRRSAATV